MTGGAITLKYKKIGDFYKPVTSIEIQYKKEVVDCLVLVDSGADECIFDGELCDILGIDLKSGEYKEFGGIARDGTSDKPKLIPCYKHKIGITIKGHTRTIEAYFTEDLADWGYSIVGQIGFFDKFKTIKFDYNKRKIIIKP
jgi:hypothetical protein